MPGFINSLPADASYVCLPSLSFTGEKPGSRFFSFKYTSLMLSGLDTGSLGYLNKFGCGFIGGNVSYSTFVMKLDNGAR